MEALRGRGLLIRQERRDNNIGRALILEQVFRLRRGMERGRGAHMVGHELRHTQWIISVAVAGSIYRMSAQSVQGKVMASVYFWRSTNLDVCLSQPGCKPSSLQDTIRYKRYSSAN
jgi:hypothetical protein